MRALKVLTFACAVALAIPALAAAHPGDLDPTFGSGGRVANPFATMTGSYVEALAVQPDGKLLVGGENVGPGFSLTRRNLDGSPDTSFGVGGVATANFGQYAAVKSIAVSPSGKIAAVGSTSDYPYNWAVAVFNANGSPDTGFSTDGALTLDFSGGSDLATAVEFAPDNGIAIVGNASMSGNFDVGAAKFKSDGTPETAFNVSGHATYNYANFDDAGAAMKLLADGSIIVGGSIGTTATIRKLSVMHFLANGTHDSGFGSFGVGSKLVGVTDSAADMVTLPSGKYLVLGDSQGAVSGAGGYTLVRFNSDGSPDTTFGNGGAVVTPVNGLRGNASSLELQSDGKILAGGDVPITGGFESVLIRYNPDGTLDPTFGAGGFVLNSFSGTDDEMMALTVQLDGKIVAGTDTDLAPAGGSLFRYLDKDPLPVALAAKFGKPAKRKLKSSKFKLISGTAVGDGLTKVQVAIGLPDSKLLKKHTKCRFAANTAGSFKKYKAVKKKCVPGKWLTAKGTSTWSLKLTKQLRPGRYKLYVRAVGSGSAVSKTTSRKLTLN